MTWKIVIGMSTPFANVPITDPTFGGLKVDVKMTKNPDPADVRTESSGGGMVQTPPDGIKDDLSRDFLSNHVDNIRARVEDALSGQNRFVFPGNGVFSFSNPLFNYNGDLLVNVEYRQEQEIWDEASGMLD